MDRRLSQARGQFDSTAKAPGDYYAEDVGKATKAAADLDKAVEQTMGGGPGIPDANRAWWDSLDPATRQQFLQDHPDRIGALDGLLARAGRPFPAAGAPLGSSPRRPSGAMAPPLTLPIATTRGPGGWQDARVEEILRAAERLLATSLSEPVDLGGSARSAVLRCRTADGRSVIVKAYTGGPDALRGFTAEAAGLALGLAGPPLLGVDPDVPLVVLADLGDAPSLADVLLGDDPKAAEEGLLAWAGGLGRLAARSVDRRADLTRLWARYAKGMPTWADEPWIRRNAAVFPGVLEAAGVAVPDGLAEELERIGTAGGEEYPAFTPGDTCPDNNLLTPQGLRLLDFEVACYQSVFLTAAYCRMPFATCWCVFALPAGLARRIEEAYRAEVVPVYPALAEDSVWEAGMRQAVAVWTVNATVRLLPRTAEDRPTHRTRRPVPTWRQVLRHRWETAAALDGLPAFTETMRLLHEVADGWGTAPLPGYPCFAPGRAAHDG
ncbi:hypothetical protein [Kitasatospora sp. NPDC005856]|uniref:hypothetical protein n=1 Tax=Kitasatospora sp. NPDC005856 TaxID=3154566 RepID=UPI00340F316E